MKFIYVTFCLWISLTALSYAQNSSNGGTANMEVISISPSTIPAGTYSELSKLTILGKGFGDNDKQSSRLEFVATPSANQGSDLYILRAVRKNTEVIHWSDEKIEVYLNNLVSSGTITIQNDKGERFTTEQEIYVPYSINPPDKSLNARYLQYISMNNKDGYTLHISPDIFENTAMTEAIHRAIKTVRCATKMNISITKLESVEQAKKCEISAILWSESANQNPIKECLGYAENQENFFMSGADFYIDSEQNWNFSLNPPTANQMDFESYLLRYLCKFFGLNYVNNPQDVMYDSLYVGDMKRQLILDNLDGFDFVLSTQVHETLSTHYGEKPRMQLVIPETCEKTIDSISANFELVYVDTCQLPAELKLKDVSKNASYWKWTIQNDTEIQTSTEQNPSFQLQTTGNFTVFLEIESVDGQTAIEIKDNYVLIPENIIKLQEKNEVIIGCPNQNVTLDAGNENSQFLWSNGETTQNIDIQFDGTYFVTITNGNCRAVDSFEVEFEKVVQIIPDTIFICQNDSIKLEAIDGNEVYHWFSSVGFSDTINYKPVIYPEETAMYYVVSPKSETCSKTMDSVLVVVEKISEIVGLPKNRTLALCENTSKIVQVHVYQDDVSYEWSNGEMTNQIEVAEEGIYFITVKNAFGCQKIDSIQVIKVKELQLETTPDTSFCEGENGILLEANGASNYEWFAENIFITNSKSNIWINPKNTTTYTVIAYADAESNCEPVTKNITVNVLPKPTLDLGKNEIITCESEIELDVENEDGIFQWSNGTQNQSTIITESGIYFVTVIPKNCHEPLYDSVKITFIKPDLDLGENEIKTCESITLNAGENGVKYLWSNGATTQTLNVENDGTYFVSVEYGCGITKIDEVKISFFKNTNADFMISHEGGKVDFIPFVSSSHEVKIDWEIGNENAKSYFSNNLNCAGNYDVTMIVQSENCESKPLRITKTFGVSFSELTAAPKLIIYPNPAVNQLFIERCEASENIELRFVDVLGKTHFTTSMQEKEYFKELHFECLVSGVYFLQMKTSQKTSVYKIVKE